MISKRIHYFWFGGEKKPDSVIKCINTWKKYCPDYEIIEWNESNSNINFCDFTKKAYEAKKYAFVSDVLRLWVVYTYGGIYLDTDVELLKSYDDFLENDGFIGFENNDYVNTGQGFGADKGNKIIGEMLDFYKLLDFDENNIIKCTEINTKILVNNGLVLNGDFQNINGFVVYPQNYFNPYDDTTGKLNKTDSTYSIHWYAKTWMKRSKAKDRLIKLIHRVFGTEFIHNLAVKLGFRK